ncbi:hypothetical protein CPAV1605_1226 [seawater metagenome]|uniref:Peptidase S8/S53 domain-containing protein n=1 Tax=seawater metagenome TaxID=1561972 RepID=A0A5E8CLY9_9ZZZZ
MKILFLDSGIPNHIDIPPTNINDSVNFFSLENSKLYCNKYYYKNDIKKPFKSEVINDLGDHETNLVGYINSRKIGKIDKCEVITGKILNKDGCGTMDQILAGLEFANKIDPKIINIATGYPLLPEMTNHEKKLHYLIREEIVKLYKKNIIIVCACSNHLKEMLYPAKFNETISVSIYYNPFEESEYICNIEYFITTSGIDDYKVRKGSSLATVYVTSKICKILEQFPTISILELKKVLKNN